MLLLKIWHLCLGIIYNFLVILANRLQKKHCFLFVSLLILTQVLSIPMFIYISEQE